MIQALFKLDSHQSVSICYFRRVLCLYKSDNDFLDEPILNRFVIRMFADLMIVKFNSGTNGVAYTTTNKKIWIEFVTYITILWVLII
jgi:hypothetical protein